MGNYASKRKKVGYLELRESIPGSLVSDQDFDLFYSLCRIESVPTISTLLHPSHSQLFFVVVSGEVHVHLTSPDVKNKPVTAAVFKAGETIHFFNLALKPGHNVPAFDFGECIRNGNIKLALHFKNGPNSVARVIGIDRPAFDDFLVMAQNNTHALNSFLGLTVAELPNKSPFFKTITVDQMGVFGPLLKIRLSFVGKMLSPFTAEMALQCQRIGTELTPRARKEPLAANYTPCGEVALLLSGTCLSVPYEANLGPAMQRLVDASQPKVSSTTPRTMGMGSASKYGALGLPSFKKASFTPAQFTLSTLPPPIFHPVPPDPENSLNSAHSVHSLGKFISGTKEVNAVDRSKMQVTMHPGTLMGLAEYFCRTPRVVPRASLASSPCVMGYLDLAALDALFAVDPRFERVLKRNYNMLMMAWLKPVVPLLRDMDEWSFALLSCKIFIRSYLGGAGIYKKGDASDFAYIMLCGSVKEVTESGSLKVTPTGGQKGLQIERIMNWGTLFGEVALVTNSPYFNTTTAQEPTLVLCISKHVLEQIYNNNKTKLCEIRIRLLGGDVGLHHVIDHPRGSVLLQSYLDKELAGESLRFYLAVDRYDSMCKDLKKQYNAVVKLREDNADLLYGGHNSVYSMHVVNNNSGGNVLHDVSNVVSGDVYDTSMSLEEGAANESFITLLSPHSAPVRSRQQKRSANSESGGGGGGSSGRGGNADVNPNNSSNNVHVVYSGDNTNSAQDTSVSSVEVSSVNNMYDPHPMHTTHNAPVEKNPMHVHIPSFSEGEGEGDVEHRVFVIPADPGTEHSVNNTHISQHTAEYSTDPLHTHNPTPAYPPTTTSTTSSTNNNTTYPTTYPAHSTNTQSTQDLYTAPYLPYLMPSSTQSSFAYSSTKTSNSNSSNKSMIPYLSGSNSGHHAGYNNSMDMSAVMSMGDGGGNVNNTYAGNGYSSNTITTLNALHNNNINSNSSYGSNYTNYTTNYTINNTNGNTFSPEGELNDGASNKGSVQSHGSVRSMDSNQSEHFLHSVLEGGAPSSVTLYDQLHPAPTHPTHPTHAHHNPFKLTHKPMLESIMSESNFSVQTVDTDGEGNSSVKFSVKHKPTPQGSISAGAYYSSKIAPLMEHEEENEEEGTQTVAGGSAFTVANLKKAMQYATGVVEGSISRSSPAISPKHSAVSPKHGSATANIATNATATNNVNASASANAGVVEGVTGGGGSGKVHRGDPVVVTDSALSGSGNAGVMTAAAAGHDHSSSGHSAHTRLRLSIASDPEHDRDRDHTHDTTNANTNESHQSLTHGAAHGSKHQREHSPERAQEVARSITQKLHRIQKNIVELKQVARTIMQTYIYNGSEAQLNLPDTLRIRTEQRFAQWSSSLLASVANDTAGPVLLNGVAHSTTITSTSSKNNNNNHPLSTNTANTGNTAHTMHHPTNTTHSSTNATINATSNPAYPVQITSNLVRFDSVMTDNTSGRSMGPHAGATHPQFRGSAVFYSTYNTDESGASGKMGMSGTMSNSTSSRFVPAPIRIPNMSASSLGGGGGLGGLGSHSYDSTVSSEVPALLPPSVHSAHGASYNNGFVPSHANPISTANTAHTTHNDTTHAAPNQHTAPTHAPLDLDLSFTELFDEAKVEILKLLRDDKFPRFKNTPEFHAFIASIKPYEKEQNADHSRTVANKSGKSRNSAELDKSIEF